MPLTHLNEQHQPGMVDVSAKPTTARSATARATVVLGREIMDELGRDDFSTKKGSVIQTATLAGTMAVKQTWSVIPLCHAIPVSGCKIAIEPGVFRGADAGAMEDLKSKAGAAVEAADSNALEIRCTVKTNANTGVEMEALHGATVAALTVYDMCKAMSKAIRIEGVRLVEKRGGKTDWNARS